MGNRSGQEARPSDTAHLPHAVMVLGGPTYGGGPTVSLPEALLCPYPLPMPTFLSQAPDHCSPAPAFKAHCPPRLQTGLLGSFSFPLPFLTHSLRNQDVQVECHPNWGHPTGHFIPSSSPVLCNPGSTLLLGPVS